MPQQQHCPKKPRAQNGFPRPLLRKEAALPLLSQLNRRICSLSKAVVPKVFIFAAAMLVASPIYAQGIGTSPWVNAVQVLEQSFTGPIATGLALVSIVVGGLVFAFGEGGAKRTLAGIIFGVGMAVGAVNFMAWLFPAS